MPRAASVQARLLSDTIGDIYEAALEPGRWNAIGSRIAHLLGSPSTALFLHHRVTGPGWLSRTQNFTDEELRTYQAHYHKLDVWAVRAAQIEKSRVFTNEQLMPDADFARTEFYQDWSRKVGGFRVVGTVMDLDPQTSCIVGVHREKAGRAFGKDERETVERLLPHLRRALLIKRHLNDFDLKHRSALDALERVSFATFVVGRDCEILHSNRNGERLLRTGKGLRSRNNRLQAAIMDVASRLDGLIRQACDHRSSMASSGGVLTIVRPNALPLTVLVAPVRPSNDQFDAPAALVLVRDPEQATAKESLLRELFGFTAMEARLAETLSCGHSLNDFARANDVSANTVKTHLRGLFLKTNTKRQAELVSFLLRSVGAFDAR